MKEVGGRVLVHCAQGVSRSSTIVIAYLIWKENKTFEDAYRILRIRRAIVSPNVGFMVQCMNFHKRLFSNYEELHDNLKPKCFAVGCHQLEDPQTIVVRLIEKLYAGNGNRNNCLDPRGVFLVANSEKAYIWIGSQCHQTYKELFIEKAKEYIKKLQKYENFPKEVIDVKEGEETQDFWDMFGLNEIPSTKYEYNNQWKKW